MSIFSFPLELVLIINVNGNMRQRSLYPYIELVSETKDNEWDSKGIN